MWNFAGALLIVVVGIALVFLLDTGSLVDWIVRHKESKFDEIIAVGILLLGGLSAFFLRRWLGLFQRLSTPTGQNLSPVAEQAKRGLRRDLIGIGIALVVGVILVFLFDTGMIVEWLAKHKETKVDEVIVMSAILLVGLAFFSVRRWMELSDNLEKYEELHQATAKLNREANLLGELSDLLQSCLSLEEAYPIIANRVQNLLPGSAGAVCIIASSRNLVEVVSTWGEPALAEPFFGLNDCWALRRGRTHIEEADGALHCVHLPAERPRRALCVPMMAHGETLGLLYVDSGIRKKSETDAVQLAEAEQRLVEILAERSSLAVANLKLREILRMQSIRDPLTNLYNRRYMEDSLDRELARATRKKTSLGLMMLDVDHFKRFNDTFGHEAGDSVLCTMANLLRTQLRAEDVICRYGGEEFTVILPDASLESSRKRAEQLRESVRELVTEFRGQKLDRITLSIGVSSFPESGIEGKTLLEAADAALYRAKAQGRDGVVVASELQALGSAEKK